MKPNVLEPVGIRVHTPLASLPSSLAKEVRQMSAVSPVTRFRYSREAPVVGSRTALMAGDVSCSVMAMMLAAAAYREEVECCPVGGAVRRLAMSWLVRERVG